MKRTSYCLEPFDLADHAEVFDLWQRAEGVGTTESDRKPALRKYLRRNPGLSFVVRCHDKIVGAVLCGHDGRRGYLNHLAVEPEHRRRGVAKLMLKACLASLKRCGVTRCNIYLFADNKAGERFWSHNGWRKRDDLVVMQRRIPAR